MTPEERKIYMKEYREKNKERIKENKDKWRLTNKESVSISNKKQRDKNHDQNKINQKIWSDNNKDKIKKTNKIFRLANPDYMKQYREKNKENISEYNKKYRKENSDKIYKKQYQYNKNRRENDPLYKLTHNIRKNVRNAFKRNGFSKKSKTCEILGCTFEEFKQYLESKFEDWMSWSNYGLYNGQYNYGWDIDHIIPVSTATTEEELLKLNHFSNLQPLCSYTNRNIKKDKY